VTQIDSRPPVADNDHWLDSKLRTRQRHSWRIVAVALVLLVTIAVHWIYSYNPLAQSWQQFKGEYGSYVGTVGGVEAHFTTDSAHESPLSPMAITVWNEPKGKFVVQLVTEINNISSHAVHIVGVGEPSFDYNVSG
jgi:hypothetical protein